MHQRFKKYLKETKDTHTVDNPGDMTVEELVESIRGKIQRTLNRKAEEKSIIQKHNRFINT